MWSNCWWDSGVKKDRNRRMSAIASSGIRTRDVCHQRLVTRRFCLRIASFSVYCKEGEERAHWGHERSVSNKTKRAGNLPRCQLAICSGQRTQPVNVEQRS